MERRSFIVTTKIHVPPRRPTIVRRPRLVDFLHAHIDRKLIVVAAPAGYGKTTLLVDFAHDTDAVVCWYSLDAYDQDPRVFLDHLIASIQERIPKAARRTQAALMNAPNLVAQPQLVAGLLANELTDIPDYLVIILDDFQEVADSETVREIFSLLLQYVGENVHFIVASRTVPRIPNISLLVARQEMVGLGVEMLRFTPEEIQALVRQNYGLEMPRERAEDLARHSDGWITGILLMAQSMGWRRLLEGAIALPAASRHVYDYLAEQVLDQQSPLLRDFLLYTSVLDEMTPERCNALLGIGNAGELLETLVRRNLFITELEPGKYAYHTLFRDFLRLRLRRFYPQKFRDLALRAAQLYEEQEEWERAVPVYLELGLHDRAAAALQQAELLLFEQGRWAAFLQWADALPPEVLARFPALLSSMGRIYAERGEPDKAEDLYRRALEIFERTGDVEQVVRVRLRMAILFFYTGRYQDTLYLVESALPLTPNIPEGPAKPALTGALIGLRGLVYGYQGKPEQAIPELQQALRLFRRADDPLGMANAAHSLGVCLNDLGRLKEAEANFKEAIRVWERLGFQSGLSLSMSQLARTYGRQGLLEEAWQMAQQAFRTAHENNLLRWEATALSVIGEVAWLRGDATDALRAYAEAVKKAEVSHYPFIKLYAQLHRLLVAWAVGDERQISMPTFDPGDYAGLPQSAYLDVLIAFVQGVYESLQGHLDRALEALTEVADRFRRLGYPYEAIRARLHAAYVAWRLGDLPQARSLVRAVVREAMALSREYTLLADVPFMPDFLRWAAQEADENGLLGRALALWEERRKQPPREKPPVTVTPSVPSLPATPSPVLAIYGFGPPRVEHQGQEVLADREIVKLLLFYLLTRYPHPVSRRDVAAAFWPRLSDQRANANLRITLLRLRRVLDAVETPSRQHLRARLPEGAWYDVWAFEDLLRRAEEASDPEAQCHLYEQALALYRGPFLATADGVWILPERERLAQKRVEALLKLAALRLRQRAFPEALEHYQVVLQDVPYHEEAWRGIMRCHALAGNRAAAIAAYRELVRLLREDLGVDPEPATQALYRAILDMQQPDLR